ncbi:basic secretory protein-like protein, partial [Parabacteroides sp.]|uniref:basic secretory protein-like protein n=1 Tax=Parabacteroides sp. TaxID=1869337 RepID=UPI00257EB7D1
MNVPELSDGDPTTCYTGTRKLNRIVFDPQYSIPIQSYKIYSSGESPVHDPASWVLKGSYDGKNWVVVDERKDQRFCSRYQEILCPITNPSNYKQYMLEAETAGSDTLVIGDVLFSEKNLVTDWEDFRYPAVDFEVLAPETKGAAIYADLVQDPDAYLKYHARKVAEILFYTAKDTMNDVQTIHYTLKDYDGVSAKSGNPRLFISNTVPAIS